MKKQTLFQPKTSLAPDYYGFLRLCEVNQYKLSPKLLQHFNDLGLKLFVSTFVSNPGVLSIDSYVKALKNCKKLLTFYDNSYTACNTNAYIAYKDYLNGKSYEDISKSIHKSKTQVGRYISRCKYQFSSSGFQRYLLYSLEKMTAATTSPQRRKLKLSDYLYLQASASVSSVDTCCKLANNCNLPELNTLNEKERKRVCGYLFSLHPKAETAFASRLSYEGRTNEEIISILKSLNVTIKPDYDYVKNSKRAFYSYIKRHKEKILAKIQDITKSNFVKDEGCVISKYKEGYDLLRKAGLIE